MEVNVEFSLSMKKFAIIVAAGSGERMKSRIPKQFLPLLGKPLLYYTLKAFIDSFEDMKIVLVLPKEHVGKGQEIIDGYFDPVRFRICEGGSTRFESVKNGLDKIEEESIVFVHDGVRCLVTPELIRRCYDSAREEGMAIPAIRCKDSVRLVNDNGNEVIDRKKVMLIQTPQAFHSHILLQAYQIAYKEQFTDEASVVEEYGLKIFLVPGEEQNIKITTREDLHLASCILTDKISEGNEFLL